MRYFMVCDPILTGMGFVEGMFLFLSVVVGLITVIIAFSYMIGSAFKEEKYISFAKKELYNLAISLLILTLFLPIVSVVESVTCDANNVSMYDYVLMGMDGILYGEVYPILNNLYKMSIMQQSLSAFKLKFGPGSMKPLGFMKDVSKSLNLVNLIMETSFTSIYIQSLALSFFKATAFNVFLPIGILFRAMPYLRSYGAFIIAFSISLSTIYPYIYYISLDAYYNILSAMNFKETVEDAITPTYLTTWMGSTLNFLDSSQFYFLTFFSYTSLREIFFTFGRVLFLAIGVPALALIFTVACTSSISKFLKEVGS